jgi:hypothetical protein
MTQPAAAKAATKPLAPGLLFAASILAAFALFAIPAFIIRPFSYQSPRALRLAMAVRQAAPLWTLIVVLAAFALALRLWPQVTGIRKVLIVVAMMVAVASAGMSRVDYFEWMFHPISAAGFESAAASKLDGSEMVMAVKFGADTRAYPIREMAYHHVLNDSVGGVPIVVTY